MVVSCVLPPELRTFVGLLGGLGCALFLWAQLMYARLDARAGKKPKNE